MLLFKELVLINSHNNLFIDVSFDVNTTLSFNNSSFNVMLPLKQSNAICFIDGV